MNAEILNALKIVFVTFVCSAAIMPFMKRIAKHIGAIDYPRSDEGNRHIHKKPIPKLGGVWNLSCIFNWLYAFWRSKCSNELYFNW